MKAMEDQNSSKIRAVNLVKKSTSVEATEEEGGKEVCKSTSVEAAEEGGGNKEVCKSTSVEAAEEGGGNKEVCKSTSFKAAEEGGGSGNKEVCICSPTMHPGSFKCRLHRASPPSNPKEPPKAKAQRNVGLSRFSNDVSQGNN